MARAGKGLPSVISALLLACGPNVIGDDGADAESDSSGTTGSSTTAMSTASTTATSTTATTTVGTTDTTTTTTTGPAPGCAEDYVIGCQSYCAATLTCDPGPDGAYEECVNSCVDEIPELDVPCQVGLCEAFLCFGALDCATLDAGSPECEAMLDAIDECVAGDECFVGAGPDGQCEYGCSGLVEHNLRCDAEICTCFENDVETATCPSNGVCDNPQALDTLASACCGW